VNLARGQVKECLNMFGRTALTHFRGPHTHVCQKNFMTSKLPISKNKETFHNKLVGKSALLLTKN